MVKCLRKFLLEISLAGMGRVNYVKNTITLVTRRQLT